MAIADTGSFAQYAGELFLFGNSNNPFLAAMGSAARITTNFDFAVSSSATLASGTQTEVSETDSVTAPTTNYENYTRDQDVNSCQIIQKYVRTSNKMLSSYNKLIGNASDYGSIGGDNMITDVHTWNTQNTLKEIYKDLNWCCWNGTYQRATNAATAGLTRGLNAAITTNETESGVTMANMTKTIIDEHLGALAFQGYDLSNTVIWVNAAAKIKLSALYSLNLQSQPLDRTIGGVNIQMLVTDFGMFPIVFDADVPAKKIFFIDMASVSNVWCPVPGKGMLYYEEKADAAAARTGMIYGQYGFDHGAQEVHSVITTI